MPMLFLSSLSSLFSMLSLSLIINSYFLCSLACFLRALRFSASEGRAIVSWTGGEKKKRRSRRTAVDDLWRASDSFFSLSFSRPAVLFFCGGAGSRWERREGRLQSTQAHGRKNKRVRCQASFSFSLSFEKEARMKKMK